MEKYKDSDTIEPIIQDPCVIKSVNKLAGEVYRARTLSHLRMGFQSYSLSIQTIGHLKRLDLIKFRSLPSIGDKSVRFIMYLLRFIDNENRKELKSSGCDKNDVLLNAIVDTVIPEVKERLIPDKEAIIEKISQEVANALKNEIALFKRDCHIRVQEAVRASIEIEKRVNEIKEGLKNEGVLDMAREIAFSIKDKRESKEKRFLGL